MTEFGCGEAPAAGWEDRGTVVCACMGHCLVCAHVWARGHPQLSVCVSVDIRACVPCTGGGDLLGALVTTHTAMVSDGCACLSNMMSVSQWSGSPLSLCVYGGGGAGGLGGCGCPGRGPCPAEPCFPESSACETGHRHLWSACRGFVSELSVSLGSAAHPPQP